MRGYDYDGVITKGILPEPGDIIITGRCPPEDVERTYRDMEARGIKNTAVYFMPPHLKQRGTPQGLRNTGMWKAKMIELLRLEEFFEDDATQYSVILEECKRKEINCKITKVG